MALPALAWAMLAGLFAMAGLVLLQTGSINPLTRIHFWSGAASLAAMGAAIGLALGADATPGTLQAGIAPACMALACLLAAVRCGLDPQPKAWQPRLAAILLMALGLVFIAQLVGPGPGMPGLLAGVLWVFVAFAVVKMWRLARTAAESEMASQRQRLELAHASRLSVVGELAASIAHEINQPLGAILSNADAGEILLDHGSPPLDEIRRILGDIRRDGLRASEVIRGVRTLAKKREMTLEKLDANELADDAISLLESEARRRWMSVTATLAEGPLHVRGDRATLVQVLINLVLNSMDAIEALDRRGKTAPATRVVSLEVSRSGRGEVQFEVVDAGEGIPPEHLDRLFESFYTSKPHGMGLGLSISRSIVEANGGRIQAGNNPGGGARILVILPAFDEAHG